MHSPDVIADTGGGRARPAVFRKPRLVEATRKESALWLLEQMVPRTAVNNLPYAFRVPGEVDVPALQAALTLLLGRYPVLRTVYYAKDVGLAKEELYADEMEVDVEELTTTTATLDADLHAYAIRPFTLDGRPLVRVGHFRGAGGDAVCLVVHHLVFDSISTGIFAGELADAYDAIVHGRKPPAQLRTEVAATPEVSASDESMAYWRAHLEGFRPGGLELACGTPDTFEPSLAGDNLTYVLDPAAKAVVQRLQRELRAPEGVILLAAYYLLLAAHGAGPDIVVGSPLNVRPREAQAAIGYHVNTLPLRLKVDFGESFRDLVGRTRSLFFEAMNRGDVAVDQLLPEIERTGSVWRTTLFRHMFNYVPDSGSEEAPVGGMAAERLTVEHGCSKFDLEFFILTSATGLGIRAVYHTGILARSDVEALVQRYEALLIALGEQADRPAAELPIRTENDREVIAAANRTESPDGPATVLGAIAAHVSATPDAPAIQDGDREAGYDALWNAALATGQRLAAAGVAPGDVVALEATPGPEYAAAVLGIWLANATCLPVAPGRAPEQLKRAKVLLAAEGIEAPVPVYPLVPIGTAAPTETPRPLTVEPSAPALVLPGSSTVVGHTSLAATAATLVAQLSAAASDAAAWLTPGTSVRSLLELLLPLVSGGRAVVVPDAGPASLPAVLDRCRTTILHTTPTLARRLVAGGGAHLAGLRVLCSGEPLPVSLARQLLAAGCEVHTAYLPADNGFVAASGQVTEVTGTHVDVGTPAGDVHAFVVDAFGRELPVGVRGELCLAGPGVDRHGDPGRFGEHPVHGHYRRTGDLARWSAEGTLDVLGAAERRAVVRGQHVELRDVEAALLSHSGVAAAAVVVSEGPEGPVLTAFAETTATEEELTAHLRGALAEPARPGSLVFTDELARTPDYRVDLPALEALADAEVYASAGEPEPITDGDELVVSLVELFREMLDRGDLQADADFFTSGGHSMLGAQLVQRIDPLTGVRLKLADLFAHRSPAALAVHLREVLAES